MSIGTTPGNRRGDIVAGQHGYTTSQFTCDIPECDLVSYILGRGDTINPNLKIYVNADDEHDFITYDQAWHAIRKVSRLCKENGLKRGDCVCIHSYNHIHYPLLWIGIVLAGGIVTGSNPANTTQELIHHFSITNTKFIIAHSDRLDYVREASRICSIHPERIFAFGAKGVLPQGCNYWNISCDRQPESGSDLVTQTNPTAQSFTVAAYATTSGTTGLPKAAELTHRFFVAQLMAIEGLHRDRRQPLLQLHCLPVFHAFATPLALLLPLRLGITTYYLPRFHISAYVNAVHRFQITDTAVVPPIITALSKLTSNQHHHLRSLRFMICAGAPLTASVQFALGKVLHPDLCITQCWGCTETGWISAFQKNDGSRPGSVGYLLPNTTLKLIDLDNQVVVEDGGLGEAHIKSESMLQGYLTCQGRVDKSDLFDKDGFYATGDVVSIDQGKIYIQGRVKDVMKVNGWQVSPDELQNVIMQLAPQGVQDCAVMGCNRLNGDGLEVTLPRAYVVKYRHAQVSADDIRAHVKRQLVSYKQLTSGVVFVTQIPRSPTGKILRRLLESTTVVEDKNDDHVKLKSASRYLLLVILGTLYFMIDAAQHLVISVLMEKLLEGW